MDSENVEEIAWEFREKIDELSAWLWNQYHDYFMKKFLQQEIKQEMYE